MTCLPQLLPNNNTDTGTQELMDSLTQIQNYFETGREIAIEGTDTHISVVSSQISDVSAA